MDLESLAGFLTKSHTDVYLSLFATLQAFPSISTGVYRFPIPRASELAAETVGAFLASSDGSHLERVIFCVHGDKDLEIYQKTLGETFEG